MIQLWLLHTADACAIGGEGEDSLTGMVERAVGEVGLFEWDAGAVDEEFLIELAVDDAAGGAEGIIDFDGAFLAFGIGGFDALPSGVVVVGAEDAGGFFDWVGDGVGLEPQLAMAAGHTSGEEGEVWTKGRG